MKVIAKRGYQLLFQVTEETGFIYDVERNMRFEEQYIQSIFARGYWEEYKGKSLSKEELERIEALPVIK